MRAGIIRGFDPFKTAPITGYKSHGMRGVVMVHDPTNTYPTPARFTMWDLAKTADLGYWPNMSAWIIANSVKKRGMRGQYVTRRCVTVRGVVVDVDSGQYVTASKGPIKWIGGGDDLRAEAELAWRCAFGVRSAVRGYLIDMMTSAIFEQEEQ